jgi:pimeloyl-ACP methyl ester carboxylesterase
MREAITFELDGHWLQGTCHSAEGPRKRGVLFFNSGAQPRSGRGDLNVRLADAFAREGYPAFRFDLPGLGDSEGDLPSFQFAFHRFIIEGGYAKCAVKLTRLLIEAHHLQDVVLMGICGGALTSVYAATSLTQAEIAGLVLLDLPFYLESNATNGRPATAAQNSLRSKGRRAAGLLKTNLRDLVLRQSWAPRVSAIYGQARTRLRWTKSNQMPANTNLTLQKAVAGLFSQRMPILLFSACSCKSKPPPFDFIDHLRRTSGGFLQHVEAPITTHSFVEKGLPELVEESALKWLSGIAFRTA